MRAPDDTRRRGRTRWLLLVPVIGLTAIISGIWALQSVHPQIDRDMQLDNVPPLAIEDAPTCTRQGEDGAALLREAWPDGGRISSEQIFACPAAYDGADVGFVGEVVGELLHRRGGAWAQVNDDAYALDVGPLMGPDQRAGSNSGISLWIPDDLVDQIEVVGRAGVRGDVVLVTGNVYRTDPDDGGGTTIRARDLTILAEGENLDTPVHVPQAVVALVLALIATATSVWAWRSRRL